MENTSIKELIEKYRKESDYQYQISISTITKEDQESKNAYWVSLGKRWVLDGVITDLQETLFHENRQTT